MSDSADGLALLNVRAERERQDEKWGEQNHSPEKWMVILMEEVGEAAEAILEKERDVYRHELVQVAAVALAAIECLDRLEERALEAADEERPSVAP